MSGGRLILNRLMLGSSGLLLFALGGSAHAAGSLNFHKSAIEVVSNLEGHHSTEWGVVSGSLMILIFLIIAGFFFKRQMERTLASPDIAPQNKMSFSGFLELIAEFAITLTKDCIGKGFEVYVPLFVTLFFVILFTNLSGLIPGLPPATASMSTNAGMAISVFILYNWAGFKEHGMGYLKQFIGPSIFLAPLILVIELIGHAARPFSLSLRLYANLFADHLVVDIFSGMTVLIVPTIMMLFGVLVACIQAYIFVLLSGVYISLARSHDH